MHDTSPNSRDVLSSASDCNDARLDDLFAEISDRARTGQAVDCEDYCRRYPHWADAIRAAWPALETFAALGAVPPAEDDLTLGMIEPRVLGDYRILRELGRGGMGIVYEAEQLSLGRRVALKVLPSASLLDQRLLQRFHNEAQAAASLQHRNVVKVHAVGVEQGIHYFSMELIHGQSFAELIERCRSEEETQSTSTHNASGSVETNPFAGLSTRGTGSRQKRYRNIARLMAEVAEALEYAHKEGIVHRDVKPSNLLLNDQGNVFIADFGLAQIANDAALTVTGDVLGTLRYMSPEQLEGQRIIDGRTDVYGLGLVLYELVTLRPAFASADRRRLLREISDARPISPRRLEPGVPRDLETIVMKATAREPSGRYATAGDFAEDLQRFALQQPIHARRASRLEHLAFWTRRNPSLAAASALLLLILTFLAIGGPLVAVRQRRIAKSAEDHLFAHSVRAAYDAWQAGDPFGALEFLTPHANHPRSGRLDYSYLWHRLHQTEDYLNLEHPQPVERLAVSPDGRFLVTACHDRTIRRWDLATQQVIAEKELAEIHSPFPFWIAYTPDGRHVLWASRSGSVGMLRASDLSEVDVQMAGGKIRRFLAVSSDGTRLAMITQERRIVLMRISTQGLTMDYSLPVRLKGIGCGLEFSPDGRLLACSDVHGNILVWNLTQSCLEKHVRVDPPYDWFMPVVFSPDGQCLSVCGRSLTFWSTESWRVMGKLDLGDDVVFDAMYSQDGRRMAIGQRDVVVVVDVETLDKIDVHRRGTGTTSLSFCGASDQSLAIRSTYGDEYHRVTLIPCNPTTPLAEDSWADRWTFSLVAFDEDSQGRLLQIANYDFVDTVSRFGYLNSRLDHGRDELVRVENADCTAFAENRAARIKATFDGRHSFLVYEPKQEGNRDIRVKVSQSKIYVLQLSEDGQCATGIYSPENGLWSAFMWRPGDSAIRVLTQGANAITSISASGRLVASVSGTWQHGVAKIFDVQSGAVLHQIRGSSKELAPCAVAVSEDDRSLAVGFHEGVVEIWDLVRKRRVAAYPTNHGPISALAFSGELLAVGHGTSCLSFYDINVGHCLVDLPTPGKPVSLAFSADGRELAAGCLDAGVIVWTDRGQAMNWSVEELCAGFNPPDEVRERAQSDSLVNDFPKRTSARR